LTREFFPLAAAGIGIVGFLAGVVMGQRMSRSWQREQWLLDRRVEEFRELLDALADSLRVSMKWFAGAQIDSDGQREMIESHETAMRVIRSRSFVVEEVHKFQIEAQWSNAVGHHHHSPNTERLAATFNEIRSQIVIAARPTLNTRHTPWFKRLFSKKLKNPAQ
jgi:hypothetical protein